VTPGERRVARQIAEHVQQLNAESTAVAWRRAAAPRNRMVERNARTAWRSAERCAAIVQPQPEPRRTSWWVWWWLMMIFCVLVTISGQLASISKSLHTVALTGALAEIRKPTRPVPAERRAAPEKPGREL